MLSHVTKLKRLMVTKSVIDVKSIVTQKYSLKLKTTNTPGLFESGRRVSLSFVFSLFKALQPGCTWGILLHPAPTLPHCYFPPSPIVKTFSSSSSGAPLALVLAAKLNRLHRRRVEGGAGRFSPSERFAALC